MRPRFHQLYRCALPVGTVPFVLSATISVCIAQTATDPQTRAKEIAAMTPVSERADMRKQEVKELSVVLSGVELILRDNINKLLDIGKFDKKIIPSVSRMRFMHRIAPEQIAAALRPYGYYRSTVEARLSDLGTKWQAVYRVKPGDLVPVKTASIEIIGDGADDPEFTQILAAAEANIRSGETLNQQMYDTIKRNIQSTAANLGYFDAEFLAQEIVVDLESYSANVTLHFSTGDRYRIGEITMTQDKDWLSDEMLAKYVDLKELDPFNANEIQKVQSDLSGTLYYQKVDVRASAGDAVEKVIPVTVDLTHRNPKQYVYGVGYGTDTGARVSLGVTRRRVNNRGHQYQALASASEIGFELGYAYTIPTRDPRTDSYGLSFNIEEQDTDEKQFRNVDIGGNYRYRDENWFKTYSLNYQFEEDTTESTLSRLLIPGVEWVRTKPFDLEERINVFNGNLLRLELRGSVDDFISDTTFAQAKVTYKHINSFLQGNRFIATGTVGTTAVSDFSRLPQSIRFFTGGDNTVRGYGLDRISPLDENFEEAGGKHLAELSFEIEREFRPNFSWAVFTDFGDAFDDEIKLRNSVGLGFRWRSPIGPIRIDAGRGFDSPSNGNWHLHFRLGPDI